MGRKVTIQSYADYFGVSRQAIHVWLRRYMKEEKREYSPYDMSSVFAFFEYLQQQYYTSSNRTASHMATRK
jgi:hypothetical protein